MSEPTSITFEAGYRRLQEIADEVNQTEVPVDRMADLFAEAKGLDKVLTDHLEGQRARIEKIERGEDIQAFKIDPPTADAEPSSGDLRGVPGDAAEFAPPPVNASSATDDDIPF